MDAQGLGEAATTTGRGLSPSDTTRRSQRGAMTSVSAPLWLAVTSQESMVQPT